MVLSDCAAVCIAVGANRALETRTKPQLELIVMISKSLPWCTLFCKAARSDFEKELYKMGNLLGLAL